MWGVRRTAGLASPLAALLAVVAGSAVGFAPAVARAQACSALSYRFAPDCYRVAGGACAVGTLDHPNVGPQIAVWLESADRTRFVDTLMVTNLTAARGLGNRPGVWNFLSGPWFPYGKRQMALPVWAHARGVLYDAVVMQDDREDWLGFHEVSSSPEPYYCRPLGPSEVTVDAVSCPTAFNSVKGKLDPGVKVYYPPRNDLTNFTNRDCRDIGGAIPCPMDASQFAALNDLDAVAAATPALGAIWTGRWTIPADLPAGDYALMVEVAREFDRNDAYAFPSFVDHTLDDYGVAGNLGQPSVVYRVPVHLDPVGPAGATAGVSAIAGYGDWSGADGDLRPRDGTISTTNPGSGEMRLLEIPGPVGMARVHLAVEPCVCVPPASLLPPSELGPATGSPHATTATFQFRNAGADGAPVQSYEIRYREGKSMDAGEFAQSVRGPQVAPGDPGTPATFELVGLKPATAYVVGVRALGNCGEASAIAALAFATPVMKFTQLSGCFVATAAFGGALQPEVAALRRARDRLRPASSLFAVGVELYGRAGPAAADLVARSATARALARRVIAPFGAGATGAFGAAADPVPRAR